jgi:hypothetical protein
VEGTVSFQSTGAKKTEIPNVCNDQTFILELFEISLESLILAQDERWRRA